MFRRTTMLGALCVLLVLAAGTAIAKKPPKPPPDPVDSGVIYYETVGGLYAMDSDGSNKDSVSTSVYGAPSRHLHWCPAHSQDERFFLRVQPVGTDTYPNQVARHELFAVCEQGTAFQLTHAPLVEPEHTLPANVGDQPHIFHPRPQWFDGDTQVSYTAMRWGNASGEYEVVEWGFYVLTVDPEDLYNHEVEAPTHVDVEVVRRQADHWSGGRVNLTCGWSPDGTAFVYQQEVNVKGIWRADLVDENTGEWSTTQLTEEGALPRWSPVGSRILFKDGPELFVSMDPYDSSDQVSISVEEPRRCYGLVTSGPTWSPNGTHLLYQMLYYPTKKVTNYQIRDIYRDKVAGGGEQTCLTDDTDAWVTLSGWVADS